MGYANVAQSEKSAGDAPECLCLDHQSYSDPYCELNIIGARRALSQLMPKEAPRTQEKQDKDNDHRDRVGPGPGQDDRQDTV
jgi:hypothetical protein